MTKKEMYKNARKLIEINLPLKQIKLQLLSFGFEMDLINETLDEILGLKGMDQNIYNKKHRGWLSKAQIVFLLLFFIFIFANFYFLFISIYKELFPAFIKNILESWFLLIKNFFNW